MRALHENFYYEISPASQRNLCVMRAEDTLAYICDRHCSVCRYGDGEFEMVRGTDMSFQIFSAELQARLREILQHPRPDCLICVPDIYGSLARYTVADQSFWRGVALCTRSMLLNLVPEGYVFGDTEISRPYMGVADKISARRIFESWKRMFRGKRLLVVEGRYSRLGVGNDLFSEAAAVRRIWCPPTNAFASYEKIRGTVLKEVRREDLVLIALGATATVLAYDLSMHGLWAIDIGHIDVEYMWMKMGAQTKVPIPGRYVNEVLFGGREAKAVPGEEASLNVLEIIN